MNMQKKMPVTGAGGQRSWRIYIKDRALPCAVCGRRAEMSPDFAIKIS